MKLVAFHPDRKYGLGSPARSRLLELGNASLFCLSMTLLTVSSALAIRMQLEHSVPFVPAVLLFLVHVQDLMAVSNTVRSEVKYQLPSQTLALGIARFAAYLCVVGSLSLCIGFSVGASSKAIRMPVVIFAWICLLAGSFGNIRIADETASAGFSKARAATIVLSFVGAGVLAASAFASEISCSDGSSIVNNHTADVLQGSGGLLLLIASFCNALAVLRIQNLDTPIAKSRKKAVFDDVDDYDSADSDQEDDFDDSMDEEDADNSDAGSEEEEEESEEEEDDDDEEEEEDDDDEESGRKVPLRRRR